MDKPNIVYILADDMGYGDVSCLNADSKIHTPNLDRLGREGMIFRDAHSSSAVCTPSRYSILTGRYNWRSRLKKGVTYGYDHPVIEEGRETVASFLGGHGYRTACVGKWHLGWHWAKKPEIDEPSAREHEAIDYSAPISGGPTDCGFDYFFGMSASLDMAPYVWIENDLPTAKPDRIIEANGGQGFWREGPIAPDFTHAEVLDQTTEKALHFIRENAEEKNPFFLYFPLTAPHTPILPGPEFQGKSGLNAYGDFCLHIDHVVGRILEELEKRNLSENTIVIFTSDNGCSPQADFDELHRLGHRPSYVFRGHKADIYEGGHRVPLLVRWPERIRAGSVTDETVCLIDFFATCAEILGVTIPHDAAEDSVSNLGLWEGKQLDRSLREATVHHSIDGSFAIRAGRWKLEMCAGSGGWSYPQPGAESDGLPPIQLYDLEADISERRNLQAEHPEIVKRLEDLLTAYIKNGRSTPGPAAKNTGGTPWDQCWWMMDAKKTEPSAGE